MKVAIVVIGALIGIIGLIVADALLNGWVLSILWDWFMVPVFGLPPLGIAYAIGISLVVALLTHQQSPSGEEKAWKVVVGILSKPFLFLLIGWIVHQFV